MSPNAPCPKCGTMQPFHEDEMKGVREGEVLCAECSMERQFYAFMYEVLNGEHPELVAQLRQRMEEEREDDSGLYIA